MNKSINFFCGIMLILTMTSCLKTRADVAEQDQEYLYGQRNAENQVESQQQKQQEVQSQLDQTSEPTTVDATTSAPVPTAAPAATTTNAPEVAAATAPQQPGDAPAMTNDPDSIIRNLNGRVETLENQVSQLNLEKENAKADEIQKITLLQEALTQLDARVQRLEGELPINKTTDKVVKSIDDSKETTTQADKKKLGTFETAEQYYGEKDWKKAILNYQKYTDEYPKGKHVADSKFKIGSCFQELGMKDEAMAFYEEVVANYGKTSAGKKAKTRLNELKK